MDNTKRIEILVGTVKHLQYILSTMINDMNSLSINDENRTGFSDELQEQIWKWKEEIDTI